MRLASARPRLALTSATIGAVSLIGGWSLAASVQPDGYSATRDSISALAGHEAAQRWVMTAALVITGLAHVVTALNLPSLGRHGRTLLALAGVATLGVAAVPLEGPSEPSALHTVIAAMSFLLLALWPAFSTSPMPWRAIHRAYAVAAVAAVATLGAVAAGWIALPFGLVERLVAALLVLTPWFSAVTAWWLAGHRIGSKRVRRSLGFAVMVMTCGLSGTAATAIAPVTTETRHYAAQVSLDPNPLASASLLVPTVFGDIDVGFTGLAPGIRALPQVKASITELLARPKVTASTLAPGPLELDSAVRSAAIDLGLRFFIGALFVAGLVVVFAYLRRKRWAGRRTLVRALAAATIATLVTGASVALTYRPERASDFASTGVLSTVEANASLLQDVEARSADAAPYLTNLVALVSSLKSRYTPAAADSPAALRLLLVSDLHVGNQYPLAKTLITEEKLDAVIDSGDLVTFGTVQEAEAAGIFQGIASLGVPYFFVRGNHDATSSTDTALLDRLARIPNVVLLQPTSASFTEAQLHGIRIRGVNDTRWFGDDGKRTAARQEPAIAAYRAAYADDPAPDLLVTHHLVVARTLDAAVSINGHMHTPFLEGHRIQVGTFTGGGPFTHYVATEDGAELAGQPSAFDILTFGEDCRVTSLSRFRFRNLIEGRPAYDEVALVNGSRIDTRPVDPARACASDQGLTQRTVVLPPSDPTP